MHCTAERDNLGRAETGECGADAPGTYIRCTLVETCLPVAIDYCLLVGRPSLDFITLNRYGGNRGCEAGGNLHHDDGGKGHAVHPDPDRCYSGIWSCNFGLFAGVETTVDNVSLLLLLLV